MILIQSFNNTKSKNGKGKITTKGKITVEVDDIFKLFTRTYMEEGDPDFWLMDREEVASQISSELPYGMSIRWQDGLWRFLVYDVEDPINDDGTGYGKKWATVEELRKMIPDDIVKALEELNDKTLEF